MADEAVVVRIIGESQSFQQEMNKSKEAMASFSSAGAKSFEVLQKEQKSWTADLSKGNIKRELKQITGELGSMAGAGGTASKAMGALLNVVTGGPLLGGIALLTTGLVFLVDQKRKAAEEAQKLEESELRLATAFDAARVAGVRFTEAQAAIQKGTEDTRRAHFRELIEADRKELERLNAELANSKRQLDLMANSAIPLAASSLQEMQAEQAGLQKKINDTTGALQAHEAGFETVEEQINATAEAVKNLGAEQDAHVIAYRAWVDTLIEEDRRLDGERRAIIAERKRRNAEFDKEQAANLRRAQEYATAEQAAWEEATGGIQTAMEGFLTSALSGTQNLNDAWKELGANIISEAEKALANAAVNALFSVLGGALFGVGTPGGGLLGSLGEIIGLAEGNARVTKPTLAVIGEGSEAENVLTDSQLAAVAGGGMGGSVIVNFYGPGPRSQAEAFRFGQSAARGYLDAKSRAGARTGKRTGG